MKKHRVLQLGCGGISGAWLSAVRDHFSERVEFIGFVDLSEDSARARAQEFGFAGAAIETSLEKALRELKPDVVFNCTIPQAHRETCKMALEAGSHVLVEKPLAANVEEASDLVETCQRTGKTLAVIQNRRFLSTIIAARDALKSGAVGRVHTICADFFLGPHFGGFRDVMPHVLLLDMAIHTLDQARFLTGLDARSVYCREFNPVGSWYAHGASAMAIFEMQDGAIFNYRGSWCAQGLATSWQGQWRIIGERGTMTWDGENEIVIEVVPGQPKPGEFMEATTREMVPQPELPGSAQGHAGNIGDFLDALDRGVAPQTAAADNIRSLEMVEAAVQSAESSQVVVLK